MQHILITGAAGFIGSHMVKHQLDAGNHVIAIDNFTSSTKENLEPFESQENFTFIEHDICESITAKCDIIYNFACAASPAQYQKQPVETTLTCVQGVYNMLELAKKTGATLFQASTSEVYGDPQIHPQPESYYGYVNPTGIRACYDEGKRCAETLCFDYYREYNINIRVGRLFNTYGPHMHTHDGRCVTNFIHQALTNQPITIYGDGSQTRSFCYYQDTLDAILAFTEHNTQNDPGPLNIGNPTEITIQQLAETILALTESKSTITNKPLPENDPIKRKPDISKAQSLLKWTPKTPLEEGLKHTIDYIRTQATQLNLITN